MFFAPFSRLRRKENERAETRRSIVGRPHLVYPRPTRNDDDDDYYYYCPQSCHRRAKVSPTTYVLPASAARLPYDILRLIPREKVHESPTISAGASISHHCRRVRRRQKNIYIGSLAGEGRRKMEITNATGAVADGPSKVS